MSHPPGQNGRMILNLRRPMKTSLPLALTWSHYGELHRVTPWPEVRFERLYGDDWIAVNPDDSLLEAASLACRNRDWRPYLDFVPTEVRTFLAGFSFMRMEALLVAARCPGLLHDLIQTPALTAFVAAHASLRGASPAWTELNAVHERSGVFGVLEWLGLPASRQTLRILTNLESPDLPKRFLAPLRTQLWEPQTIFALQRTTAITDRHLARFCHAAAA